MEQDKQYFCKSHNSGPFTKTDKGSQNMTIFSFHNKCEVIEYDESLLNPQLSPIEREAQEVLNSEYDLKRAGIQSKDYLERLKCADYTQTQFADYLLTKFNFLTLEETDEILIYENGVFVKNGEIIIKKQLQKIAKECSNHLVNEVTNTIRRQTYTNKNQFDNEEFEICLLNCILNVKTGHTTPHTPDKLFRNQLKIIYDKEAKCPKFQTFFKQFLPIPQDRTDQLEAFASGLLKNSPKLEAMHFLTGTGDNGKSTYLKIVEWFYGKENCATTSIHRLVNDRFATSRLEGKRINFFPDIESNALDNFGILKAIVSGDSIDIEYKHGNSFTFTSSCKHFFSANELPPIKDKKSYATYKRIRITKCTSRFLKKDEYQKHFDQIKQDLPDQTDDEIKQELAELGIFLTNKQFFESISNDEAEKSGLLNLLLEKTMTIIQCDGFSNEYDLNFIIDLWESNSSSIARFGLDCLVQDSNSTISKKKLFEIYVKFCAVNRLTMSANNVFHPTIKTKYSVTESLKNDKGIRDRCYTGLAWNPSNEWLKSLGLIDTQSILS